MIDIGLIESVLLPLIYFVIFFISFIVFILILARFRQLSIYHKRIASLPASATYVSEKQILFDNFKHFFNQFVQFTHKLFVQINLLGGLRTKKLSQRLSSAGWRSKNASTIFLLSRFFLASTLGLIFLAINNYFIYHRFGINQPIAFTIIGALLGLYLTDTFVKQAIRKYRNNIRKALPDALDLMVICFEAGYSNDNTLQRIAKDFANYYPELAEELDITATELQILPDRKTAWANFADRTELIEVHAIVSALQQNDRYGTPLAKALKTQIEIFRRDRIANAEKRAAKIPVLLAIPLTLFFIPILFITVLSPAVIRLFNLS